MTDPEFERAKRLLAREFNAIEVADDAADLDALLASRAWLQAWNRAAEYAAQRERERNE